MADKTTYFGRAGEFFAMSELLVRGWNVAVPVVDVGDDVFVIDDNDKTTYRVQVKAAEPKHLGEGHYSASFALSRSQLKAARRIELFYMLLMRTGSQWRYLVIPRDALAQFRDTFETAPRKGPGRPPTTAEEATTDTLNFVIELGPTDASGWGASLANFVEQWPDQLPSLPDGPGKRSR